MLAMCGGELFPVIAPPIPKCLWSGGSDREELIRNSLPFPCPENCDHEFLYVQENSDRKNNSNLGGLF